LLAVYIVMDSLFTLNCIYTLTAAIGISYVSFEIFIVAWLGVLSFWDTCVIPEKPNYPSAVTQNMATIYNLILSYISLILIYLFPSFSVLW
jgi:hypothetical protein